MALAVARRELSAVGNDNALPSRDEVLAHYRRLREISKRHHHEVLKLMSGDAILRQARRLGLAQGKTLILGRPPPDGTRAAVEMDRGTRSVSPTCPRFCILRYDELATLGNACHRGRGRRNSYGRCP